MYLRSLQLANYRNFRRLALTLDDGPTIVQGENAQGKTNLLEAIELLATTRSARTGSERELIHWAVLDSGNGAPSVAEPFARIVAVVGQERGETRAEILLRALSSQDDSGAVTVSKTFRLNGLPRRALEFVGEINVVSFSPEDVELVAGPPEGRRRYLDVTNAQMSARYLRTLQRFRKVLLQRNNLLRQLREGDHVESSLGVWNQELASTGAFLFQERARAVDALGAQADRWFRELGGWGQRLEIRYQPGLPDPEHEVLRGLPPETDDALGRIHSAFLAALARLEARERAAAMSLTGPHRDDLSFLVDGIDLNTFGSRGQQRLAALALKLAEVDVLHARVGSRPILLLDDVLSELDVRKQDAVLRVACGPGQTILTVTSLDLIGRNQLPHAAVYRVEAGALVSGASHAGAPEAGARPAGTASEDTPQADVAATSARTAGVKT